MGVWKKQTVRYLKNGKRCSKGTKGAKPKREESKRFYGTLKLASGKTKQIPLTKDEKSSERLLQKRQMDEDKKEYLGIDEIDEKRTVSVMDAIDNYVEHLRNNGCGEDHAKMSLNRLRKLFKATMTTKIGSIDAGRILKILADWRRKKRLAINTTNHYLRSAKSFTRWLLRERFLKHDPLFGLSKQNAETDRRRVRRPFMMEEFNRLREVVGQCRKRYLGRDWQFLPDDRVMLYTLAVSTGLRAKELSSLKKTSFDFQSMTVTVEATNTKNKQKAVLPLTENVCTLMQGWFGKLKTEMLFPGSWIDRRMAGKMLQRDLKRSEIPYRDAKGRVLDFHSLRYTFITNLAKANVHPSKAQRLARHSTIALTMDVYTQLDVEDLREAVNVLPSF